MDSSFINTGVGRIAYFQVPLGADQNPHRSLSMTPGYGCSKHHSHLPHLHNSKLPYFTRFRAVEMGRRCTYSEEMCLRISKNPWVTMPDHTNAVLHDVVSHPAVFMHICNILGKAFLGIVYLFKIRDEGDVFQSTVVHSVLQLCFFAVIHVHPTLASFHLLKNLC